MKFFITLSFIVASLFVLSACGKEPTRPSVEAVAKVVVAQSKISNAAMNQAQATCFAEILVDSSLRDSTLKKLVSDPQTFTTIVMTKDSEVLTQKELDFFASKLYKEKSYACYYSKADENTK